MQTYGRLPEGRLGMDMTVDFSTDGKVPLVVNPGDAVLLHANVVHFSEANTSDRPRHAYTLHVAELDGQHEWSKSNWLQRSPSMPFVQLESECRDVWDVTTSQ
eukprot:GHVQ01004458.1.p1 GENE.GHVQ01004458.1~~GHVQ01004458.1.p1  ORF type:complete len:103 (-),score=16.73 GHVQ01004458.1:284-592(-)